jgi:hypothetical protein
MKLYAS